MISFQSHIYEKAGNGTIGLYKKDGQGGYTASDDETTNHDCEEEHPGVSHKKWVATNEEDAMSDALDENQALRKAIKQDRRTASGYPESKIRAGRRQRASRDNDPLKDREFDMKFHSNTIRSGPRKGLLPKRHIKARKDAIRDYPRKSHEEIDLFTGLPLDELTDSQRKAREKSRTRTHGGVGMTKTKDDFGQTTTDRGQMSASAFAIRVARDKKRQKKNEEAFGEGLSPSQRDAREKFRNTERGVKQKVSPGRPEHGRRGDVEGSSDGEYVTFRAERPPSGSTKTQRRAHGRSVGRLAIDNNITRARDFKSTKEAGKGPPKWKPGRDAAKEILAAVRKRAKKRQKNNEEAFGEGLGDRADARVAREKEAATDKHNAALLTRRVVAQKKRRIEAGRAQRRAIGQWQVERMPGGTNEEVEWEEAQYWSEDTVTDFLKRGGKITKLPTRGKPRTSRKVKVKGVRPTGKQLSDRAERKMQRSEEVDNSVAATLKARIAADIAARKTEDAAEKKAEHAADAAQKRHMRRVTSRKMSGRYEEVEPITKNQEKSKDTNESKASQVMAAGKAQGERLRKARIARGETPTEKNPYLTGKKFKVTKEKGSVKHEPMEAYHNTLSRMASRTKEVEESMDEAAGDRVLAKKGQYKVLTHDKLGTRLVKGGKEILKGYYDDEVFAGQGGWFMRVKGKEVPFREASDIIKFAEKGMKEEVDEGLLTTPIVKAAQAAKAGSKHSVKAAAKAGISAYRRGVGDELIKKGQKWHGKDLKAHSTNEEVENVDELSKATLSRYSREASREISKISPSNIHPKDRKNIPFRAEKERQIARRKKGIDMAAKKLAKKEGYEFGEGLFNTPITKAVQAAKAGAKHSPKAAVKAGVSAFRRGVGDELVKKGQKWHGKDTEARRRAAAKKTGTMTSTPKIRDEEYEYVYENVAYLKNKEGHTFVVSKRDTKGMRGKQDKFSMSVIDKKGKPVKDYGSHVSVAGAKKFATSRGYSEEVEISEIGPALALVGRGALAVAKSPDARRVAIMVASNSIEKAIANRKARRDKEQEQEQGFGVDEGIMDKTAGVAQPSNEGYGEEYIDEEITKQLGEAVSVDGRTKGYRDALTRIAARHKVIADRPAVAAAAAAITTAEPDENDTANVDEAMGMRSKGRTRIHSKGSQKIRTKTTKRVSTLQHDPEVYGGTEGKFRRNRKSGPNPDKAGSRYRVAEDVMDEAPMFDGPPTGPRKPLRPAERKPVEKKAKAKAARETTKERNAKRKADREAADKRYGDQMDKTNAARKAGEGPKATPLRLSKSTFEEIHIRDAIQDVIAELSKKTLGSYTKAAARDLGNTEREIGDREHAADMYGGQHLHSLGRRREASKERKQLASRSRKRQTGIARATDKLTKEEEEYGEFTPAERASKAKAFTQRKDRIAQQARSAAKVKANRGDTNVRAKLAKALVNLKKKGISQQGEEVEEIDEITNISDWYKIKGYDAKHTTPSDSPRQKTVGKTYRSSVGIKSRVTAYKDDDKGTYRASAQVNSAERTRAAIQRLAKIKAKKGKLKETEDFSVNEGARKTTAGDYDRWRDQETANQMAGRPPSNRGYREEPYDPPGKDYMKGHIKRRNDRDRAYKKELARKRAEKKELARKKTEEYVIDEAVAKKTTIKKPRKVISPELKAREAAVRKIRRDRIKQGKSPYRAGTDYALYDSVDPNIIEEGGMGGNQSNVTKSGTHSSNLNYITRSKKQGWSDRGRSSAKEKKLASKEARRAGKQEIDVDEAKVKKYPKLSAAAMKRLLDKDSLTRHGAAQQRIEKEYRTGKKAPKQRGLALTDEFEVDEAKLRLPKETGTPGFTKARGPKTPYEKSKAFIAAHKRDNKGKHPTQAQLDKALELTARNQHKVRARRAVVVAPKVWNEETGAQKVIAKYKKRAADAQKWKKDNNKKSLGIEETANVGDKNAPVTSQDMNYLSDFHKDVYGTRPRGVYKHIKTVGDYQKEIKALSKTAEAEQSRVKQDRVERKKGKATEKKIQKKRTFGPKGGTSKTTLTPAFKKALAKSRSKKR